MLSHIEELIIQLSHQVYQLKKKHLLKKQNLLKLMTLNILEIYIYKMRFSLEPCHFMAFAERTVHLADVVILFTESHTRIWKKSSSRKIKIQLMVIN